MFKKKHMDQIRRTLKTNIANIIQEKARRLEEAYKENPIINNAKVVVRNEEIDINISLKFTPKDEEQNIPALMEYGGVIFDTEGEAHEIEPGFYIRQIMTQGVN